MKLLQDDGSCFYPESEEFCDCDGSQVDALGECGGSCEADADSDGVCDDIDPCVGIFDECDICNGLAPFTNVDARASQQATVTVKEINLMR